jgi:hypothetical protein
MNKEPEKYYVQFDQEGNIIGRYTSRIHNVIPPNTIEVTLSQFNDTMQNPGKWIVIDGKLVLTPPASPEELLREAKESRVFYLINRFNEILLEPVSYKTESNDDRLFDSSDLSLKRIAQANIDMSWPRIWIDYYSVVVAPFNKNDIENLLNIVLTKKGHDPKYKDLLALCLKVHKAKTIEEVNLIDF